jgi:hypothetical protein
MGKLAKMRLLLARRATKLALAATPWFRACEAEVGPERRRASKARTFDAQTRSELMALANRLLEDLRQNKSRDAVAAIALRLAAMVSGDAKPRPRMVSGRDRSWRRSTVLDDRNVRSTIDEILLDAIDPLTDSSFDIEMVVPELFLLAKSILQAVRKETFDPQILMEAAVRLALFVRYVDLWTLAGRELIDFDSAMARTLEQR